MDQKIQEMMGFIDGAHSVYHAVAGLVWTLEAAGYTCLPESARWELVPGGKYYMTRGGSAVVAFRVPNGKPEGFMMSASHADRPTFRLKENGEITGKYTRLAVEPYGGMLMAPWLDRPLSLAGRVMVETDTGIESRLVDIDRDLLLIPNVAIHVQNSNKGYHWNPAVDMLPLLGGEAAAGKLTAMLEEAAGGKILGQDLYLYIRQKTSVWGVDEEYISGAALDDLICAWCCTQSFLNSEESRAIPVLCVFNNEEVGSASVTGANSDLLESVLRRICDSRGLDLDRMLSQSFMVSADNAHGLHPNHPEYADSQNAPVVGGGVAVKFNEAKYTSDGLSAAIFRKVCQRAGVPTQTYCNRADMPGGSTLGNVSLSHVSVPSVDVGIPQLAMHSAYETAGVQDVLWLEEAMTCYYGTTLTCPADGSYHL